MLDIKFIRDNAEVVKKGCIKKGEKVDIDRFLELDIKRRKYITEIEHLREERNKISNKNDKKVIENARKIKEKIKNFAEDLKKIEREFKEIMLQIPNLPKDTVPEGKDNNENVVSRTVGKKPKFDFKFKDYMEIAKKLDLIDIKRAAKISGTRFGFLKGDIALMEFALINFAFDVIVKKGFIPIIPPVLIKSEMARGMGYLEQGNDKEAYYISKDDFYLAGTAEQPIGTMHAKEIFEEEELPKRYVGFSTCFRREAGAYGKDTKGILRVHQFDKVEMFSFCNQEDSEREHLFFLKIEEELMQALCLPYQVIDICAGDLGAPAAIKYDIEVWIPSENRYRETHSTSNCTDFQARRLNIRYKNKKNELKFVSTINGTAFAMPRLIIAIIENYQQKDGSIKVPKVLEKYLAKKVIR